MLMYVGVSTNIHQTIPLSSVATKYLIPGLVSCFLSLCTQVLLLLQSIIFRVSAQQYCGSVLTWSVGCSAEAPGLRTSCVHLSGPGRWQLVVCKHLGLLSRLRPSNMQKTQNKGQVLMEMEMGMGILSPWPGWGWWWIKRRVHGTVK